MSSKIDGVPRELLERVCGIATKSYDIEDAMLAGGELRALLAAPVVERQPVAWFRSDALGCVMWKPRASLALKEGDPLYTAPPELAELQATIARLTAENGILQKQLGDRWGDISALQVTVEKQEEEIERLKGGQGEPVTQCRYPRDSRYWEDGTPDELGLGSEYFEVRTLYTSQPAPVSVVLPERECEDCFQNDQSEQAIGFNRAIDKVKELNQ